MIYTRHTWQLGSYTLAHADGCAKIRARDRTEPPPDPFDAWPCPCLPIEPPTPAQRALCARRGIPPASSRIATKLRLQR